MPKPRLVLVSGMPASGKTTLAHEIGRLLPCPVICRDEVKEGLVHAGGGTTPEWGAPIADQTFELFYGLVTECLRAGCSVVAEAAFLNDLALSHVRKLVDHSDARLVHCDVDRATSHARFASRAAVDPFRRQSHPDSEIVAAMEAGTFEWDRYEPMDLGVPWIRVNTTDSYDPILDDIATFSRER